MKKQIMIIAAILSAWMLAGGCSLKTTVINATGTFMEDVVDAFFAEGDAQFAEEAAPGNLKLLDGLIRGSNYENEGLLLKGCKLYGAYAMGFLEDASTERKQDKANLERAKNFYNRAKDYGMRILTKNNDFKKVVDGSAEDFSKMMVAFGKNDVETLFWTAFAWGSYINLNRSSPASIADLPKVRIMMERVIELDGSYFYGLPHLFMIVYYSMPRMFGGNPEKAKAEYEIINGISGGKFILADYFTAKYCAVQLQDREFFDKLLENVEDAEDDAIPERLFTAVAKRKAGVLAVKADDLF